MLYPPMSELLKQIDGMEIYPSVTNFILVKHPQAVEINKYLESLGIGVRSFGNAPRLENCLRISMEQTACVMCLSEEAENRSSISSMSETWFR